MPALSTPEGLFIQRIVVKQLFGRYDYDLTLRDVADSSRLMILYGDNGSGKTTLLFLIYYLLTNIEGRGYKGFIAKTPFRRFEIDLGQNTAVVAERRGEALVGEFHASIIRQGNTVASLWVKVDADGDVTPKVLGYEEQFQEFLRAVRQLNISLFFVTDDRGLLSNVVSTRNDEENESEAFSSGSDLDVRELMLRRKNARGVSKRIDVALQRAIRLASDATRRRVIQGARQGEADVTTIYTSIVKRLTSSSTRVSGSGPNIKQILATLEQQAERSSGFAQFGLPSPRNIEDLISVLRKARSRGPSLAKVLQPYVEGTNAKLDALQEVQQSILSFVGTLNSFYHDKKIQFDLEHGLTVITQTGQKLSATALSSGEKQLLLLFCNALVAKDQATIVLIDEPEISLNIKWQRQLIPSLLETSQKRTLQFVLATHSFELFAPYEAHVVQLKDEKTLSHKGPTTTDAAGTSRHLQA